MPSSEGAKKSNAVQRQKYGEGYSEEMRRRRKLRKNWSRPGGFAWMKEHDPEKFARINAANKARRNAKSQKAAQG